MAVGLLEKEYLDGKIKREYRHELESFIWILVFVCLRYKDGKAQRGTLVDEWMTSSFRRCKREKVDLWTKIVKLAEMIEEVQDGFQNEWPLAWRLVLHAHQTDFHVGSEIVKAIFNPSHIPDLSQAWNAIVDKLKESVKRFQILDYVEKLVQELRLEKLIPDTRTKGGSSWAI